MHNDKTFIVSYKFDLRIFFVSTIIETFHSWNLWSFAQTVIFGFRKFFIMTEDTSIENYLTYVSLTSVKVTAAVEILNENQWQNS